MYCDPKIADLMKELRDVPPYALFFDLALIPAPGSPEFTEACAPFKGKTLSDNLVESVKPEVYPLGSSVPLDLDTPLDPAAMAKAAIEEATDKATSAVDKTVEKAAEKVTGTSV
jgi:hypothetical protein